MRAHRRAAATRLNRVMPIPTIIRVLAAALLAAGALAVSAYGDDDGTGGDGASLAADGARGARNAAVKRKPGGPGDLWPFVRCMRTHGVPNFPDPVNGFVVDNAQDIGADPAAFDAAWKACESLMPRRPSARNRARAAGWKKIVARGHCACADGSKFAFWERRAKPTKRNKSSKRNKPSKRAKPTKVVLYLDGGGLCSDATSCAFTGTRGESDVYNWNLSGENPALPGGGILNFDRPDNPFADYSFIYVASCTGDAYLGDVTRQYSPTLTVEHKGYVDGTAALAYLAKHYRNAAQVVVVGKTSGSIAAPVYGGLVADLLPHAQVTVLGAQSGAFPDIPDFNARILGEQWGAYSHMPDWEVKGLTARDWGFPRFWIQAGLHDPDIVMARFDYAFDPNAARAVEWMGGDASNLLALIDANEAAIEAAGVVQHSYTAPGRKHQILDIDKFYKMKVNGVRLVNWVDALIKGEPLADIRCKRCETT
jgi:Pectinacetylesterase